MSLISQVMHSVSLVSSVMHDAIVAECSYIEQA